MPTLNLSNSLEQLWLDNQTVEDPILQIGSPEATYIHDEKVRIERYWPSHPQCVDGHNASTEAEIADSHYRKLQQLGLKVVSCAFEAASMTAYAPSIYQRYKYIFAASQIIPESSYLDLGEIPAEKRESDVFVPFERYLQWCEDTEQPYVLNRPNEYRILPSEGTVFVSQPDPGLGSVEIGNLMYRKKDLEYSRNFFAREE